MQVIIMCKAPVAGRVKTRMMTQYSAEEAKYIHVNMARKVINRADKLFNFIKVASDDRKHSFFKEFNLPVISQGEGDLGARMIRLMQQEFELNAQSILFLGTDSPHMSESRLLEVEKALKTHDVVIGPVEDGGYDLIAMSQPYVELFENISWGTEKVTRQTLEAAKKSCLNVFFLDESFDIDTPEDLIRIEGSWSSNR
ncbi:MAG: TIGR04282 family arsenosugar biosynthesis glycosyltransferase [Mariprofundaceae bacterium]